MKESCSLKRQFTEGTKLVHSDLISRLRENRDLVFPDKNLLSAFLVFFFFFYQFHFYCEKLTNGSRILQPVTT